MCKDIRRCVCEAFALPFTAEKPQLCGFQRANSFRSFLTLSRPDLYTTLEPEIRVHPPSLPLAQRSPEDIKTSFSLILVSFSAISFFVVVRFCHKKSWKTSTPTGDIKSRGSDSQTRTLPTLPTPDEHPRTRYTPANSLYTGFRKPEICFLYIDTFLACHNI